jgi:hypothetical protein
MEKKNGAADSNGAVDFLSVTLRGVHGDPLAGLADAFVFDDTVDLGKQRAVTADADIVAGSDRCATLANDNRAGGNRLARKHFCSSPLAL